MASSNSIIGLPSDLDMSDPSSIPIIRKLLIDLSLNDAANYGAFLRVLAETVAKDEAARTAAAHRVYGEKCVLDIVLERLNPSTGSLLVSCQSLRFIGNCCMENERNCELSQKYLHKIMEGLGYQELVAVSTGVLYNMCITSDAVPTAAATLRYHEVVLTRLHQNFLPYRYLSVKPPAGVSPLTRDLDGILADGRRYMFDVIGMMSEAAIATKLIFPSETKWFDQLSSILFDALGKIDMDIAEPLIEALVAYAEALPMEKLFRSVTVLMTILLRLEASDMAQKMNGTESTDGAQEDEDDVDEAESEAYQRCCRKVSTTLATLSGKDHFPSLFGFPNSKANPAVETKPAETAEAKNKWFKTLLSMLTISTGGSETKKAACLMLGNIAITDSTSLELVRKHSLHTYAIAMILDIESDRELRYSAAGLLSHLAHPSEIALKKLLFEADYLSACALLINASASKEASDPQLRLSGLNLLHLISRESVAVSRLLLGLPPPKDLDAQSKYSSSSRIRDGESTNELVSLQAVTRLCDVLDPKSPLDLQQIEQIARIICAVARCVVKVGAEENATPENEEMTRLLDDHHVLTPLNWVLGHTATPNEQQGHGVAVLREVFFTFALISSCEKGARLVYRQLGVRGTIIDSVRITRKVLALGSDGHMPNGNGALDMTGMQQESENTKTLREEWKRWGHSLGKYFLNNAIHVPVGMIKYSGAGTMDLDFMEGDKQVLMEIFDLVAVTKPGDGVDRVVNDYIRKKNLEDSLTRADCFIMHGKRL